MVTSAHRFLLHLVPVLLLLCALTVGPVHADMTLGADARSVAMGGAGLASGSAGDSSLLNPATLADSGLLFGVLWPTVTAGSQGATLNNALALIGDPSLHSARALDYALHSAATPTSIDAEASMGVLLPQSDVQAGAALRVNLVPNAAYQTWVQQGANTAAFDSAARVDVYGAGVTNLPSFGLGIHLASGSSFGGLNLGMRFKPMQEYYSHYYVDASSISGGNVTLQHALEMRGQDHLSQTAFGADLGLMYTPARIPNLRAALMINNLIEPKPIDLGAGLGQKQLVPRAVSFGAALMANNITLAADLVDLTHAYGATQLRLGGELLLPLGVAMRGGYNTATGFTAGIGFGGFGLAFASKTPVMLSQTVSF